MIDTHTHLYLPEFEEGGDVAVERGIAAGVEGFMMPNVDLDTVAPMVSLQSRFSGRIKIAMGLHPTSVDEGFRDALEKIKTFLDSHDCSAIGEVGIDLYWDRKFRDEQMIVFAEQLKWAGERSLPVIIHCREALDEVLEVAGGYEGQLPPLLFHSFTGSIDNVRRIREMQDAYFGINGVVTFKNAEGLRAALPEIGLDRIVLETDSPYLAPVPHRGKRNESAYIVKVCEKVAEIFETDAEAVERRTTENAVGIFGEWNK